MSIESDSPVILSNRGIAFNHMQKYVEAIDYFEKALKFSDSTYFITGPGLSNAYFKGGKYQEGINLSNYIINNCSDNYISLAMRVHKVYCLIELKQCDIVIAESKELHKYYDGIEDPQDYIDNRKSN